HALEAQFARQANALERFLGNLRDALAGRRLLDLAGANIQVQTPETGPPRGMNILIHTASVRGELDLRALRCRARDQLLIEGLAVAVGGIGRQLDHTNAQRGDEGHALPGLIRAKMEALQRAVAPLTDRLERLANAEDAEALALQVVEQREQLGRLMVLLVGR